MMVDVETLIEAGKQAMRQAHMTRRRARAVTARALVAQMEAREFRLRSRYTTAIRHLDRTNAVLDTANHALEITMAELKCTAEELRRSELENFILARQLQASEEELGFARRPKSAELSPERVTGNGDRAPARAPSLPV